MKCIKTLSLVAIVAVGVLAIAGTTAASAAERLCETNTNPCNSPVATNGIITAEATFPKITGEVEIDCASSTMRIRVTENSGIGSPKGELEGLTWTLCKDFTHFGIGCTMTSQWLPYRVEFNTPTLTVKAGLAAPSPAFKVVCGGFISCTFSRTDFSLSFDVGAPASVTVNAVQLETTAGGGLCPDEAFLDAKYVFESPTSSLFLSSS